MALSQIPAGISSIHLLTIMPYLQVLEGSKVVERTGAVGKLRSVYCRDPDGNLIEYVPHCTLGHSKCPADTDSVQEYLITYNVSITQF